MIKKLSLAAAIACFAALSPAAYAQGIGGAIGDATNGVINAGEDIVDGTMDAGRDIVNGLTGDDDTNSDTDNDTDNDSGSVSDDTSSTPDSSSSDSASDDNSSDDLVSDSDNIQNGAGNPITGISMGYVASAAVLSAMGVVVTAIRKRGE